MGLENRDSGHEAKKESDSKTVLSKGSKWTSFGILVFWLTIMTALYFGVKQFERPKAVISANGDLVIQRARDGHFYVEGLVNGSSVKFLVDTGASLVGVSDKFAQQAGLTGGEVTTFNTAKGEMQGRIIANVPIEVGSIAVSGLRVGVGLEGGEFNDALLGQNFLSKFDVLLRQDQMILRKR
jgi:aspartyl protease family protein